MIDWFILILLVVEFIIGVLFGHYILHPRTVGVLQVIKGKKKDLYNMVFTKPIGIIDKKRYVTFEVRKENTSYSEEDV